MHEKQKCWVELTHQSIDVAKVHQFVTDPRAGAVILFCGDVRNHDHGRSVTRLEYHAKEKLANKMILEMVELAQSKWELHRIAVVHRFGLLEIGETSVAIAVSASHRGEAYAASRYLIDTLKHSVPIWKKELFADGSSQWSQGCRAENPDEVNDAQAESEPNRA